MNSSNAVLSWPFKLTLAFLLTSMLAGFASAADDEDSDNLKLVKAVEQQRIRAINSVIGSVVAIYDEDRQGGGSGVIIDPRGIALTNHHVIMGAGVQGWGGLADGNLYRWKLIGTDPGGDVSIIQMEGLDAFPFTPLGDSDDVRVGDWALAMGNPFILTEDQAPTVTLGIVSGVKRYQPGAGMNQLVYGNCIQVDSSINPGNSGGPLFNLNSEVIGINGRGSFKERGRVNVGLGYAISANQIKNFIPELLATKLVEHATLDASFSDRQGKVVCSQINRDAPVALAGLDLEDELLIFEGIKIRNANQFTNLICTLPAGWPAELVVRKKDGSQQTIHTRCLGLPYKKPKPMAARGRDDQKPNPEKEKKELRQREMVKLLSAPPGTVRLKDVNRKHVERLFADWRKSDQPTVAGDLAGMVHLKNQLIGKNGPAGSQEIWLAADGRFRVELEGGKQAVAYVFDGKSFFSRQGDKVKQLTVVEAKLDLNVVQAIALCASIQPQPFEPLGDPFLDGADKAAGNPAYRLKMLDADQDPFFGWLQMYGEDGRPAVRLAKASADKNCDEGGVTFHDWQPVGPIHMPQRCQFVIGLAEDQMLEIKNISAEWSGAFVFEQFKLVPGKSVEISSDADDDTQADKTIEIDTAGGRP
jgi:serine protease Do